jgi:type VI protein secretion system component VasF
MTPDQLHALDQGYSYGMLWVAGVAVIVGAVALFIGYTASQVAHAQEVKEALDAGDI